MRQLANVIVDVLHKVVPRFVIKSFCSVVGPNALQCRDFYAKLNKILAAMHTMIQMHMLGMSYI